MSRNADLVHSRTRIGRRNLLALYAYTASSRLWFDGGLWLIYWQHRGISLFQVGILEALLHITCLVCDVPLGIFADRFGWKVALAGSSLFGVMYTLCSIWGHGFWLGALAFALRGLQVTLASGSDASIAYESANWAGLKDQYIAVSGRLLAITLVSMGVAEAIGGTLAGWSWTALYVAFTAANALSFFAVLYIREPREERTHEDARPTALTIAMNAIRFAKGDPAFVRWIALSGTLSGFLATFAFYGQSLLTNAGWALAGIGVLSGVENGLGALSSALANQWVKRLGVRGTVLFACFLAILGLLLFAWLPGLTIGIGYLLNSIGGNLAEPLIDQGLNQIVPTDQRATLLSFNSTSFSVFMIVVFPIFGLFATYFGLQQTAHVASVIGALCILVALLWWWNGNRRPVERPVILGSQDIS